MFCGFKRGNNKEPQQQLNLEVMAKYAKLFEQDDDDDETYPPPKKSSIRKSSKVQLKVVDTAVAQITTPQPTIKTTSTFSKTFLLSKRSNTTQPRYYNNLLLIAKIRKLDAWQVGNAMNEWRKQQMKKIQLEKWVLGDLNIRKTKPENWEQNQVVKYFEDNYKLQDEQEWLKEQLQLVAWKQSGYATVEQEGLELRRISISNLILEMEYRYYIQFVLQLRSVVQRIKAQDAALSQHLVLLVQDVEYHEKQLRYYLKLSDGWSSFYLVANYKRQQQPQPESSDQFVGSLVERGRISRGDKLHVVNLQRNPIKLDTHGVGIMAGDPDPYVVFCLANSLKKAAVRQKLGQQQVPYFLRSVRGLKHFCGPVPCIDLFVIQKSYYCEGYGQNKKAVKTLQMYSQLSQAESKEAKTTFTNNSCILKCFDALHYFDNSEIKQMVYVNVKNINEYLYESIRIGDRIRLLRAEVVSVTRHQVNLNVKIDRNQGIIVDELQQYPSYCKQQIQHLTRTLNTDLNGPVTDVVFLVTDLKDGGRMVQGITEGTFVVRLELHRKAFFEEKVKLTQLEDEIIVVTQVMVKRLYQNYPPFMALLTTTECSRVLITSESWVEKYNKSIKRLQQLRKK